MRREKSFKSNTRYAFKKKLGSGGLADVYLYLRKTEGCPDQKVALKILKDNSAESIEELINEGEKLRQLKHPSILTVFGYEKLDAQTHAIVLEYVNGVNLKTLLPFIESDQRKSFAAQIGQCLFAAIKEAHGAGIVHGDISARNILVSRYGDIKLSDFGISRKLGEDGGLSNKGSLDYLSPDRWAGAKPGEHSDLFALGILIYEVLTGENPLAGTSTAEIKKNLEMLLKNQAWKKFEPIWRKAFDLLFLQQGEVLNLRPDFRKNFKETLAGHVKHATVQGRFFTQTMTILIKKSRAPVFLSFQRAVFAFLFLFAAVNPVAVGNDVALNNRKRPCFLTVTSQPWGEVFIDGMSRGYTPIINIQVTPGAHSFLWRNFRGKEVKKSLIAFNNGILFLQILAEPNKPKL